MLLTRLFHSPDSGLRHFVKSCASVEFSAISYCVLSLARSLGVTLRVYLQSVVKILRVGSALEPILHK